MLAQKYRLVRKSDFDLVFKNGKKAFGRLFFVRFTPNKLENSRFAVVISNKISKKATVRNRLRRQVREILRLNIDKFEQNIDAIVNILTPSLGCEYEELEKELIELFKKNRLIS
ncbi:MAG: ribonuclease P protein component [Patescibacteria group bacterium]|jgi:ribonuclease P protein component